MDQGVIAALKKKYNKSMLNMARIKAKTASGVHNIIREIKIFDAILHAKVTWEAIDSMTIQKCFKQSGVQETYDMLVAPPHSPEIIEDPKFAKYFEELPDTPWDQYLAMDEELEQELPARAPDTQTYCQEDVQQDEPCDEDQQPMLNDDQSLEYLQHVQSSNLGDTAVFELLERAMNLIQNNKTVTEISNKSNQPSMAKFF